MKTKRFTVRYFLTGIAFLLIANSMLAQSVTINLNLIPPYNPRLFSYLKNENKALITIFNQSNTVQYVKFTGRLEGDNGILIATKKDYRPSAPIVLNPMQTMVLTSATGGFDFIADVNDLDINVEDRIRNAVIKDGLLPEGNYTLCVQALDFNTNQPLSTETCWPFVISYIQPPTIITPMEGSDIPNNLPQFSWSPAMGNITSGNIRYDLYILKLADNQNPDDAMRQAVNYNVGNPLKKINLTTPNYIYSVSDWPLEANKTYAIQVVAKDLNNLLYFANNGKSEVSTFTYIPQSTTPAPPPPSSTVAGDFQCGCMSTLPTGTAKINFTVSQNTQFQIGGYTLTITSVTSQPDNQGRFSGEGTIPFPLVNGVNIPVGVTFTDLQVNQSNAVIAGTAVANVNGGATFIPQGDPGTKNLPVTAAQAMDLKNYFNTNPSQLISVARNNPGVSVNLPLGMDRMVDGENEVIAVTGMYFTAEKASFDAVSAINIPDATPSVLGFGRKYICLDAGNICNTQGILFLDQDVNLNFLTGDGQLLIKGNVEGSSSPADSGTYVVFDNNGFKNLRIHAEYAFPVSSLVQEDNTSQVTASISANATSWGDWIGNVSFSGNFKATGVNDFVFQAGTTFYDHSDLRNPTGIPAIYTTNDPSGSQPVWHGFVIAAGTANFPGQDLNITVNNTPVNMNVSGLVIDAQGLTVDISELDVLPLANGKINGWRFSIDSLDVSIVKNSFTQGNFSGRMLLPIAHDTSFVKYSCLLNIDNGNMDYQFALAPRDDLKVPMWKAKMDLEQSSNITVEKSGGVLTASADLNGSFDINGNLDQLKKLKLKNIQFQDMTINSATDVLNVGTLSKGNSTDDSKISGFVLDVKQIKAVPGTEPVIELSSQIELVKFVSLPLATTKFTIYGKKSSPSSDRSYYDFDKGVLDSLHIKGDLSAFKIDGVMCFYKDDPQYGDGFRGKATVEIPKVVTVTCKAQFGSIEDGTDDYKYWYFDAFADLANGVPLFPPYVYGYGFGGGAYYHMRRDTSAQKAEIVTEDPKNHANTNSAPSGIIYIPDKNTALGLKAKLLFGLQVRKTFNADVSLEMDFNNNGGINTFFMDGNARVLAKNNKSEKGMVTGKLSVFYDFNNDIFHADLTGDLDMKAVKAHVPAQFHFAPQGWYIYMGRPRPEEGCTLTIAEIFNLTAYFEGGTILDPVPSIPGDVLSVLNQCGVSTSFLSNRNTNLINGGNGIIFGADMQFHYSGTFLIIKGSLDARAGFDFSLQQTTYSCDNSGDPSGINGWYAYGQMYAALDAKLSIHIDIGAIKLDAKIFEAMAGAVLQGGAPNPTWVEGVVAGHFNVLDGLIEGGFHYKFTYGNKCTGPTDVLESLNLIADIYPAGKSDEDISIDVFPTVATNLRISQSQFVLDQIDQETGEVTERAFRFSSDNLSYNLKQTSSAASVSCGRMMSSDGFGFTLTPQNILSPTTEYELVINATVDEYVNGIWRRAKKEDGTDFIESDSIKFTTNQGLQKIPDEDIQYTIPFDRQRNFCPQGFSHGSIRMVQNVNFNSFALPVDPADYNIEFFAEFIPLGNASGQGIETPVTISGSYFNFDLPQGLQPSTIYCMQFKARWTPKQQSGQTFALVKLHTLRMWTTGDSVITQSKREINQNKLVIANNEQLLYNIYFRTSEYADYVEKLNSLDIEEMVFGTEFAATKGGNMYNTQYVYLSGDELQSDASIMSNLRQQLNVGASQPMGMLYPHNICLGGGEQFDEYDIYGYEKTNKTGHTYTTEPVIKISDNGVKMWASQLFSNIVDILEAGGAQRFALPSYNDKIGGYVATQELTANTAPLLSDNEIFDGVEKFYFSTGSVCRQTMQENVITEPPAGNTDNGMTYYTESAYMPGIMPRAIKTVMQHGAANQHANSSVQAAFSLNSNIQSFQLPDKVNVINVIYYFGYSAGRGIMSIPNSIINDALGYVDPSPVSFGSFYSSVGQAYDVATEALGSMAITSANLSATTNANLGAKAGKINMSVGR